MEIQRNWYFKKQHTITLSRLALCLYVVMAYMLHLFTYDLSALAYCLVILMLVFIYAIAKPIVRHGITRIYLHVWILALAVLIFNYLFRYRSNMVLIDVCVLLCGFVVIVCFSLKLADYSAVLAIIKIMAIFFAVGVIIQRQIPSAYGVVIQAFPSHLQSALRASMYSTSKVKGFSVNTGFTASYIIVGIFSVYASAGRNKSKGKRTLIIVLLLMIALLMTGKRGPLLFAFLAIAIVRILPERGTKRFEKIWVLLMIVLAIVVIFFLFQDVLTQIPLLHRYVASFQGFLEGEDVSSGRSRLTAWAVQLFLQHPVTGIGWGRYRTTTLDNATFTKLLDTHNVYLQLLCETGVVGFTLFVLVFVMSWNMARKGYCASIRSEDPNAAKWGPVLFFSLVFQTYFLLYCLTGNPLYDQFFQIIYAVSCSIAIAFNYASQRQLYSYGIQHKATGEV